MRGGENQFKKPMGQDKGSLANYYHKQKIQLNKLI